MSSLSTEFAAKVFVSYSRRDSNFAMRLADALQKSGINVFRDLDDILPTEEWWPRIEALIGAADTVVFIVSPDAIASPVCAQEITLCEKLGKRVAPVVWRKVDVLPVPEGLSKLNYILCTEEDNFEKAVGVLVEALNTDIGWIREHTRLGELATRWDRRNRRGSLLSGQELREAEAWLVSPPRSSSSPVTTAAQRAFILDSRNAVSRSQRWTIGLSLAVAVVGLTLAALAFWQREIAVANETLARNAEGRAIAGEDAARTSERRATAERDRAQQSLARVFAERASQARARHNDLLAARYALVGSRVAEGEARNRAILASILHDANESVIVHGRSEPLSTAVLSPDGRHIVATGRTSGARIIDVGSRAIVTNFKKHDLPVVGATFSPDGKSALSWSLDSSARIWSASNAAEIGPPLLHAAPVVMGAYSLDGRSVVTVSKLERINADPATLQAWSSAGAARWTVSLKSEPLALRVSNDGAHVVVLHADRVVETYDLSKGTRFSKSTVPGGQAVIAAAFVPDQKGFVLANADGTVSVVRSDGSLEASLLRDNKRPIRRIAAAAGLALIGTVHADNSVRIWNGETGEQLAILTGHSGLVADISFSPLDGSVVTTADDGTVRIWRAGRRLAELGRGDFSALAIDRDGSRVALATAQEISIVGLGGIEPRRLRFNLPLPRETSTEAAPGADQRAKSSTWFDEDMRPRIHSLTFLHKPDRLVAIDDRGAIFAYDLLTGAREVIAKARGLLVTAAISPDGSRAALVEFDRPGTVLVTAISSTKAPVELTGHVGTVSQLSFSSDGQRLAVGTQDGEARLWEVDERRIVIRCGVVKAAPAEASAPRVTYFRTMDEDLGAVASSAAGDRIAVGLARGLIQVCGSDPKHELVIQAHDQIVRSLAFDPSSTFLASSDGNAARMSDAISGARLADFGPRVGRVAITPDRLRLITTGRGAPTEARPTHAWDISRLSQSLAELRSVICANILVGGASRFEKLDIATDQLIADAWLTMEPDGDVCR